MSAYFGTGWSLLCQAEAHQAAFCRTVWFPSICYMKHMYIHIHVYISLSFSFWGLVLLEPARGKPDRFMCRTIWFGSAWYIFVMLAYYYYNPFSASALCSRALFCAAAPGAGNTEMLWSRRSTNSGRLLWVIRKAFSEI